MVSSVVVSWNSKRKVIVAWTLFTEWDLRFSGIWCHVDISVECVTSIFKCQVSQARVWKCPFRTQDGEKKTESRQVSGKQRPIAPGQGAHSSKESEKGYIPVSARKHKKCTCPSKESKKVHLFWQGKLKCAYVPTKRERTYNCLVRKWRCVPDLE